MCVSITASVCAQTWVCCVCVCLLNQYSHAVAPEQKLIWLNACVHAIPDISFACSPSFTNSWNAQSISTIAVQQQKLLNSRRCTSQHRHTHSSYLSNPFLPLLSFKAENFSGYDDDDKRDMDDFCFQPYSNTCSRIEPHWCSLPPKSFSFLRPPEAISLIRFVLCGRKKTVGFQAVLLV